MMTSAPASRAPGLSAGVALRHRALVIGYGNTLFGDDGIGPRVVEQVHDWCLPDVLALQRPELVPELAAEIASANEVFFVDASLPGAHLTCTEVIPAVATAQGALGHALSPAELLRLAEEVFGRAGRAWLIAVPGFDFTLGAALSVGGRAGMAECLELLHERLQPRACLDSGGGLVSYERHAFHDSRRR